MTSRLDIAEEKVLRDKLFEWLNSDQPGVSLTAAAQLIQFNNMSYEALIAAQREFVTEMKNTIKEADSREQ